jgi:hypothetical protein
MREESKMKSFTRQRYVGRLIWIEEKTGIALEGLFASACGNLAERGIFLLGPVLILEG